VNTQTAEVVQVEEPGFAKLNWPSLGAHLKWPSARGRSGVSDLTHSSTIRAPDVRGLFALFPTDFDDVPEFEAVPADEVPEPYHRLLVHEQHMTVTVEDFHGELVDVRILARAQRGDSYARKILLTLQQSRRVVQFGIMRIDLALCSPQVREEIVAGDTPLGRILVQHDVLRRIEPKSFLRIVPGRAMMNWFNLARARPAYGRLALIHCDGQPAVELLEVVAPEPPS
jgi:chorismate-pyruvate lyase